MKKEINPALAIGAIALLVIVLAVWGYRKMQPAPYLPSPGVAGVPATGVPEYANMKPGNARSGMPYTQAPTGSTPGMPPSATSAAKSQSAPSGQ
jgi:hypothetical protein